MLLIRLRTILIKISNFYNNHTIIFYLFSFILIFIGIYILQKTFYEISISKSKIERQLTNKNDSKDYKKIIEQQKNSSSKSDSAQIEEARMANKKHTVNFILVIPNNVNESEISGLVENLKNTDSKPFKDCKYSNCTTNASLYHINSFYKDQLKGFKKNNFDLSVNISEIYKVDDLNKVGDFAYQWGKDPFAVANLTDNFEKIITENNLDKNELYVFLYFDKSFEIGMDSREGSLYEAKKFRSFAISEKGRAYINVYSLIPSMSSTITEIAAHEILHLFGASDKYTEDINDPSYCIYEGRGDPDKRPIHPQTTADIMCFYIEYLPGKFKRASYLNNEVVINKYTAEEIGWKN